MRLGGMPVGGMERDKPVGQFMGVESEAKTAIRFARGHAEQPSAAIKMVESRTDTVIKRFTHGPSGAQASKGAFIVFGQ